MDKILKCIGVIKMYLFKEKQEIIEHSFIVIIYVSSKA